jgi:hypothetical protein
MFVRISCLLVLTLGSALLSPAAASKFLDRGSFRIIDHDKPRGIETFTYETSGDSMLVYAQVFETIPNVESGPDTLEKEMQLMVTTADYDLRSYQSTQRYKGQLLRRGLVFDDTLFTSYTQVGQQGAGNRLVRPPGRMFIQDPQLFTLYDVICRNLYDKTFDKRPLWMFTLGASDSMMGATATHLGSETLKWGTRSVTTRKLSINDGEAEFFVWISNQGQMLRLSQPEYGLRVERTPPETKSPSSSKPKPKPKKTGG